MSASNYPLATATWDDAEYQAIQDVIASGMFTMGAKVQEFEKQFAAYTGSKYCVMVNSGSSANLLMIAALRFRKESPLLAGEEIIVPAVSWSTTYHPLQQYGLKLKFVDVDRDTLNYDIAALAAAVTDKTRAIMIVNLLGNPNDFEAIQAIVAGRNIVVVEDNCESLGAQLNGRQAGTFGVMGTYSAFFSHHISTMEGGMVVTDDEELYHIMLSVRAHGWTRNLPKHNKLTGTKSDDAFVESFKFVLPGYNLRPLEMSGAIGIEQIRKLPGLVSERRRNAAKFQSLMADYPQLRIQREIGESSWFGFSMIVEPNAGFSREDVVRVFNEHQIDVRPIVAGNFAKNEVLRWFDYEIHGTLDNADELDRNGLFIGNHHYELDEQFDLLRTALNKLIKAKQ
ncbi:DegT/DnrJ/EryC1/StrS family aminotransferase [Herbaspirillum huttiense]|jgi:CDP-6-deoxy-D-xylo-4-hexulose-3-dehydrase|uniref:DegT/DnrJ/EryC1/StrS family aminotransferase n=2 Tax=Herbaspirillum huttiense TaxID=863372 RepID=A0AAJ2HC55_9BURK|nr:DegT/DnrJ/EryC1/StrS family aminotransferase [Herbaspirillum huttiense]MDR9836115.1 DegT/DnrJ/EryC1/StrS family aminotransferase [Herbaspirillum huttiense]